MVAFARVVEAGSFTRASETLNIPRFTVTRLVQSLETDLGVRLLHRTTRNVTVTVEGATYYEGVVRLLADLAFVECSAKQSGAKPSGLIRIEMAAAVGTMVVLPALHEFYASYPDVEVELRVGNRHIDLVAEAVDCAIRVGEISDPSLVARCIGEFQYLTCATSSYLETHGIPKTPEDLANGHDTIGLISARTGRALPFAYVKDGRPVELALRHRLCLNDTNAYLAAGVNGLGIIQSPSYSVQPAIARRHLVPVLEDWHTGSTPVHVIYAPNRFLSAKVRVFIDWMISVFERNASLKRP